MIGLALVLTRSVVVSAAEPTADFAVTVQSRDTGMPERTYDDFTVTQVIRDGETLIIIGVLTNGRPQERANIRMRIPVESHLTDSYWQQLYDRKLEPRGK
jgi:hypothetical protein